MENMRFKISQYACAVLLIVSSIALVAYQVVTIDDVAGGLLDFGRCQSVHFSAQIASFTLTMMQYNILCTVKRFEAYETVGALFREATTGTLELSASDRIWELILDTILEIAEMISADASELLSAVIDGNPKFHKLYQMYKFVA